MLLLAFIEGKSLGVKCSYETPKNIRYLFAKDIRFIELEKYGVLLNPSWFFKFTANYTLMNFVINAEIKEIACKSHYTKFLDENLKKIQCETDPK